MSELDKSRQLVGMCDIARDLLKRAFPQRANTLELLVAMSDDDIQCIATGTKLREKRREEIARRVAGGSRVVDEVYGSICADVENPTSLNPRETIGNLSKEELAVVGGRPEPAEYRFVLRNSVMAW